MRSETGSCEPNTDWLRPVSDVVEERELIIVSVTIELTADDVTEPDDNMMMMLLMIMMNLVMILVYW